MPQLCLALHEGAVQSAFSLLKANDVRRYTEEVIKHVAFEDSLKVRAMLLKSLSQIDQCDECIKMGIGILRRLNFDIPLQPDYGSVMKAIVITESVASKFSMEQVINLREKVMDEEKRGIVLILDAFYGSALALNSLFLPLIVCEIVRYSLVNGIILESTSALASYGMIKVRRNFCLCLKFIIYTQLMLIIFSCLFRSLIRETMQEAKSGQTL